MSVIGSNILAGASGQGGGYNLERSLRFRSSASAYLSRTPASAGNRKTWTWSGWVKRGSLGVNSIFFQAYDGSSSRQAQFGFNTSDQFLMNQGGDASSAIGTTTAVFRDPSAWYHIVMVANYSSTTFTLYVNNVAQTINYSTSVSNQDGQINGAWLHRLGSQISTNYFDGYLAEVNFIDGQALTPSSFGANNASTGVWQPKRYAGTYGTNGFYLPFTNNASTTTIGYDFSGNGNNFTANNISLTAGSTYDSMTDVPTLTSATASNFATWNAVCGTGSTTFSNANLAVSRSAGSTDTVIATMAMQYGNKYYFEMSPASVSGNYPLLGIEDINIRLNNNANPAVAYLASGSISVNGTTTSGFSSFTSNDIIGIAYDTTAGKCWFSKNGTWQNGDPTTGTITTGTVSTSTNWCPAVGTYSAVGAITLNCGQRPFAYTPPTGFVALNTFNLPTPTIGATASTQANKYFDVNTWTGTGATNVITNSGSMQPDFVWIKDRSRASSNDLVDVLRGVNKALISDATTSEYTGSFVSSFNSNGFSLPANTLSDNFYTNISGDSFVGWQWKANGTGVTNTAGSITSTVSANTSAGFSVVTYTGTGSAATIGHGLGVAPKFLIVKKRNAARAWINYHASLGATQYLELNTTGAAGTASTVWNDTAPSSTVVTVGTNASVNTASDTYVMYAFAEVAGYSKFGSFVGNASADGVFVYTGFKPKWVMLKRSSTTSDWAIIDLSRGYNSQHKQLSANLSDAESSFTDRIDLLSNGFKMRTSSFPNDASTFIYAAFAEVPSKFSLGV